MKQKSKFQLNCTTRNADCPRSLYKALSLTQSSIRNVAHVHRASAPRAIVRAPLRVSRCRTTHGAWATNLAKTFMKRCFKMLSPRKTKHDWDIKFTHSVENTWIISNIIPLTFRMSKFRKSSSSENSNSYIFGTKVAIETAGTGLCKWGI